MQPNELASVIDTITTSAYISSKTASTDMNTLKRVKRIVVTVIGFSMIFIGLAMVVLPGPAFIFIPAGLAILATEFIWAKKLLQKVKEKIKRNDAGKEKPPKNE